MWLFIVCVLIFWLQYYDHHNTLVLQFLLVVEWICSQAIGEMAWQLLWIQTVYGYNVTAIAIAHSSSEYRISVYDTSSYENGAFLLVEATVCWRFYYSKSFEQVELSVFCLPIGHHWYANSVSMNLRTQSLLRYPLKWELFWKSVCPTKSLATTHNQIPGQMKILVANLAARTNLCEGHDSHQISMITLNTTNCTKGAYYKIDDFLPLFHLT